MESCPENVQLASAYHLSRTHRDRQRTVLEKAHGLLGRYVCAEVVQVAVEMPSRH